MIRKILVTALLFLSIPAIAFAGHLGGLSQNMGGQMLTITADIGYKTKDMERSSYEEDFSSRSLVVKTTYGYSDKTDIYLNLGFADIQDLGNFDGSLGTLYGVGMKYLLIEGANSNTQISLDFGIETFDSEDSGQEAEYFEYYVAAVVSNKSGNFTPYGGIKVSDAEIDLEGAGDLDAKDNFGLFGGVDYFVNPNVYFTGEVHVFAEESIFLGVGYNF